MPWKGNDFQHTRSEAYAALTHDKYGQEYRDLMSALVDLENGVRSYWAEVLRRETGTWGHPDTRDGLRMAANYLDPYSGRDGEEGMFARTEAPSEL